MALARLEFRSSHTRKSVAVEIDSDGDYTVGSDAGGGIGLEGAGVRKQHSLNDSVSEKMRTDHKRAKQKAAKILLDAMITDIDSNLAILDGGQQ